MDDAPRMPARGHELLKSVGAETAAQVEGAARDGKAGCEGEEDAEALRDAAHVMNLADGNLTSSIILFPQTVASLPLVVNYKGQEYHATLTMPEGALQAGNNYTYTVKVRNKVLEVSEATIAKWNDIDGGDVGADL